MRSSLVIILILSISLPLYSENIVLKLDLEIGEPNDIIFDRLIDIATDSKNDIYVLDRKEKVIYKFRENGTFLRKIGRAGQGPGEFSGPCSIYIDSRDSIYVLDDLNRRIEVFNKDCACINTIRIINFPIGNSKRIVVDNNNNIYISGYYPNMNSILVKYSPKGGILKKYELPIFEYAGIAFDDPGKRIVNQYLVGGSSCVDDNDKLYVSYSWPYLIKVISAEGNEMHQINGKADYSWTPFIYKTNEINGMLFSESTRTIKIFLMKNGYFVNSIYVKDWEGNPKRILDMSILRKNPESYYKIKGEYAVLDFYSKEGKIVYSARINNKIYFLCSDKKGRILGVKLDDSDFPKVVRYNVDII